MYTQTNVSYYYIAIDMYLLICIKLFLFFDYWWFLHSPHVQLFEILILTYPIIQFSVLPIIIGFDLIIDGFNVSIYVLQNSQFFIFIKKWVYNFNHDILREGKILNQISGDFQYAQTVFFIRLSSIFYWNAIFRTCGGFTHIYSGSRMITFEVIKKGS